jgi:hypothetical protein
MRFQPPARPQKRRPPRSHPLSSLARTLPSHNPRQPAITPIDGVYGHPVLCGRLPTVSFLPYTAPQAETHFEPPPAGPQAATPERPAPHKPKPQRFVLTFPNTPPEPQEEPFDLERTRGALRCLERRIERHEHRNDVFDERGQRVDVADTWLGSYTTMM